MKIHSSKYILVLFLLFTGITNTKAAYNDDCLLAIFQSELKEINSKDLHDYFLNKTEEDCNKAYQAWEVLYKADKNVNRLDIKNIDIVYTHIIATNKKVDALVLEIKSIDGFASWKNFNFKYQFQKEGYIYKSYKDVDFDGIILINHSLKNGEENEIACGFSKISPDGILTTILEIPEKLKIKGVSKIIYNRALKENINEISSFYKKGKSPYGSDNYNEFMIAYNTNNNDKMLP